MSSTRPREEVALERLASSGCADCRKHHQQISFYRRDLRVQCHTAERVSRRGGRDAIMRAKQAIGHTKALIEETRGLIVAHMADAHTDAAGELIREVRIADLYVQCALQVRNFAAPGVCASDCCQMGAVAAVVMTDGRRMFRCNEHRDLRDARTGERGETVTTVSQRLEL